QVRLTGHPALAAVDLGGEVVRPLHGVDVGRRIVGPDAIEKLANGHLMVVYWSFWKTASCLVDDRAGQLLRGVTVGFDDQIVPGGIVVIDPVDLAIALAIRGFAGLDLAQALGGGAPLPPRDPLRTAAFPRLQAQ